MVPTRLIGILIIVFFLLIQRPGLANPVSSSGCDAMGLLPLAELQIVTVDYAPLHFDYDLAFASTTTVRTGLPLPKP
jgi:hypothetical protein